MEKKAVLRPNFNDTQIVICLLAHFVSFPFCCLIFIWFSCFYRDAEYTNFYTRSFFSIPFSLGKKLAT